MSSKQLNLVNGLMATMEVRQPAAWNLSPPYGSGSNYTVQRLMKTCEGNYGSWHFKKTTLDDLFGNSFKATVKTWKSPKNIFFKSWGHLWHTTCGDSANGMLWWIKSYSRNETPNVDMGKMLRRCSLVRGRTISNAFTHCCSRTPLSSHTPGPLKP